METGRSVQLQCSVDAKPAIKSVRWIRNNAVVGNDYVLKIEAVSVADAGAYTCSAENDVGERKQELQLDVLYAPVVSHGKLGSVPWGGLVLSERECGVQVRANAMTHVFPRE